MELKLKGEVFYMLDGGNEKRIFDTDKEAIESLKRMASENKSLDPEKLSIFEVNTKGEKWSISQVPWSKIAMELIKGGK